MNLHDILLVREIDQEPDYGNNYNRPQTDVNFAGVVKNGGFAKFRHGRELASPVKQGIVRPNRYTLYSLAVFDLDAGPVAITLPEAGKRFMGVQVVNEDQYTLATYDRVGTYTLTKQMIGTRYATVNGVGVKHSFVPMRRNSLSLVTWPPRSQCRSLS